MSKRKTRDTEASDGARPISDEWVATSGSEESDASTSSKSNKRRRSDSTLISPQRKEPATNVPQSTGSKEKSSTENEREQASMVQQIAMKAPKGYTLEPFDKSSPHELDLVANESNLHSTKQTWLIQAPRGLPLDAVSTLSASTSESDRFNLCIHGMEYAIKVQNKLDQTTTATLLDSRDGRDSAVRLTSIKNNVVIQKSIRRDIMHEYSRPPGEHLSNHKQPEGLRVRYIAFGVQT